MAGGTELWLGGGTGWEERVMCGTREERSAMDGVVGRAGSRVGRERGAAVPRHAALWGEQGGAGERDAGERGAATAVVLGVLAVVLLVAVAGVTIGGYILAAQRARSTADLAALSGAAAFRRGEPACAEARTAAADNGAALVECDQVGDQLDFVVTARVRVSFGPLALGLPRGVEAVAYAGASSS